MKNIVELQIPEPKGRGDYMGSGDASTCVGENKYQSPQQLATVKQAIRAGTYQEPQSNTLMRFGSFAGPWVLDEFSEQTGQVVMDREKWFRHPEHPFIGCHVDGVTIHKGIPAVVESKTTSLYYSELPQGIIAQVQQQLACTGYELAFVPVCRQGRDFHVYEVEADPMYQDFVINKMAEVWGHVLNETLPPPMTPDDFKERYPDDFGGEALASREAVRMVEKLHWLKDAITKAEDQKTVLEMAIKAEMQENANLVSDDGEIIATWRSTKPRITFNSKKLKSEYPEIYETYLEIGKPNRPFRLKGGRT